MFCSIICVLVFVLVLVTFLFLSFRLCVKNFVSNSVTNYVWGQFGLLEEFGGLGFLLLEERFLGGTVGDSEALQITGRKVGF